MFPKSEQSIVAARRYAAEALGIDAAKLSFIAALTGGVQVSVLATDGQDGKRRAVLGSYIRVAEILVVFGGPSGLVLFVTEATREK